MFDSIDKTRREDAARDFRIASIYLNTAELCPEGAAELAYKGLCKAEEAARELGFNSMYELAQKHNA